MRYLTVAECESLGEPGSQNEVTPVVVENGRVIAVNIYTQHAAYRSARRVEHGSRAYGTIIRHAEGLAKEAGNG